MSKSEIQILLAPKPEMYLFQQFHLSSDLERLLCPLEISRCLLNLYSKEENVFAYHVHFKLNTHLSYDHIFTSLFFMSFLLITKYICVEKIKEKR